MKVENLYKILLIAIGIVVAIMGVLLFFAPPAIFPDPAAGLQVMRSMELGGPLNYFTAPDQSDIAQNYSDYLTWWSPGQYMVPYLHKLLFRINTGQALAVTVGLGQLSGLAGFYCFFKKLGFTPAIAAVSLLIIMCQQAFVVPYVFYNGGEILLFAFVGWFLYGCVTFEKTTWKLLLFVLLSGCFGFFFKSSFMWIYAAGLCCLSVRMGANEAGLVSWLKKMVWVVVPAAIAALCVYAFFLSKGQTPATASKGFRLTLETFGFPLASPLLSGLSADDMLHGLIYHTDTVMINTAWSLVVLSILAVLSILLVWAILYYVPYNNYKLVVLVFYVVALLFFGFAYMRQLAISYEARHFRIIGMLIIPGLICLVARLHVAYRIAFIVLCLGTGFVSFRYLGKGYNINKNLSAKGVSGIAQPYIDQPSLNAVMKLDRDNRNAVFVFIGNDLGLEVMHNRTIALQPIGPSLKIDMDDYTYKGHAGPLFIVLPESYNGPREKMIMKSFPGYNGFNVSMLSDKFVLYSAK